jgi:hypothetical protein
METKGFISGLFDFGFTSFITLRFMKVIYAIIVVLVLLVGVVFLLGAITSLANGEARGLFLLVLAPLATLLYLVMARIWMEMIALFFRIGENTTRMAEALSGGSSPQPGAAWGGPTPADPGTGGTHAPGPPPAPGTPGTY